MPLSDYLVASGERLLAGKTGVVYENVGRITVTHAARVGVDQNLFACLKIAADQLALWLNVNSIDSGEHVKNSRHTFGRAVDINQVTPVGTKEPWQATPANSQAERLVLYLLAHGFHVGERRPWAALLFGAVGTRYNPSPVDHGTHMHVSLPSRRTP